MYQSVESPRAKTAVFAAIFGIVVGLATGLQGPHAQETKAGDASNDPADLPPADLPPADLPVEQNGVDEGQTPSFEELDSAATDLNSALAGAREKLDELRQATELAAMAAELREELEASIRENNRLAASLADVQGEQTNLKTQQNVSERQISELSEMVQASSQENQGLTEEIARQQEQIETISQSRLDAEARANSMQSEITEAGREISSLRAQIIGLTEELEISEAELAATRSTVVGANEARDNANRELNKVKKQIAGMLRSVLLGGEPVDVSTIGDDEIETIAEAPDEGSYETLRASNIRAQPDPNSTRIGFANRGDTIEVISKVDGRNWYEIRTSDGRTGYIFGDLIEPSA